MKRADIEFAYLTIVLKYFPRFYDIFKIGLQQNRKDM